MKENFDPRKKQCLTEIDTADPRCCYLSDKGNLSCLIM